MTGAVPDRGVAGADFEELLREVLSRVNGALDEQKRLRLLLDAVVSMAADLSLDGVLARIVEISRELTGARYAALGVLRPGPRKGLRTFVHRGMDPVQVAEIGALPTGHGLLGLLIDKPEPLRLHDIASHPESYGFPPGHPPMSSFLGVPVRIRDQVFGNLYLTEKAGGDDFSHEDEHIVIALAAAASVAIENARLHEEARRREEWLAATAEISGQLSGRDAKEESLQLVADRARAVAAADVAWIVVGTADDLEVRAVSGPPVSLVELNAVSLDRSLSREVLRTGRPVVVENTAEDSRSRTLSHIEKWPVVGPAILVPLRTDDVVVGALGLAWQPENDARFHEVDARLPASFAEQAALALQMLRSKDAEQRLAVFEDRDRIGRDLHDLVIQRLFAIGLSLQSVGRISDVPQVTSRVEAAVDDLDATIKDIRRSIFALGAHEGTADLQTELTKMVDRAAGTMKFRPTLQVDGPLRTLVSEETAPHLLAVLAETLSNASRHANARHVSVSVHVSDLVRLVVTDDGQGLPEEVRESGLRNIRERAEKLGGTCTVESAAGSGTTVCWSVPLR
jgi:signal transduction histidine kinase